MRFCTKLYTCGWVESRAPQARFFLENTFPWLFYSGLYSVRLVGVFLLDLKKSRIPLHKLCSLDYTIFQQLHNCVVKTRIWATTQLCSVDYTKKRYAPAPSWKARPIPLLATRLAKKGDPDLVDEDSESPLTQWWRGHRVINGYGHKNSPYFRQIWDPLVLAKRRV